MAAFKFVAVTKTAMYKGEKSRCYRAFTKKALLQLILFLASFQPHCYPQIPFSFRAEFFILPLFSLHIVSFQTTIHVPLINHHFRKLQAGRPGMKCWRVVWLLASLVYHKRSDAIKFPFPQRLKRASLCEHTGGG